MKVAREHGAPAALPADATLVPLALEHLPGLLAVQRACYGDGLVEGLDVFARRLASPANCSLVLQCEGQVVAYLAAYHSQRGKVTPLHGDFEPAAQPGLCDTLYLHDMAVLPGLAGRGWARRLLATLWTQAAAHSLRYTALVSVQGSQAYWQRQGYAVQTLEQATQRERLASYGSSAVYMARRLDQGASCAPSSAPASQGFVCQAGVG